MINYIYKKTLLVEALIHNNKPPKRETEKLRLTCLFLSSVIRWIWIFFLPMMLCSCGDKRRSQSSGEVPLRVWERKCRPLTSAQKQSDTVMHPRTHVHTHFSAQVWWGNVVDSRVKSGCCRDVWSWGVEVLSSFFVQQGQNWQTSPQLLRWRRTSLLSCMRQRETERLLKYPSGTQTSKLH